MAESPCEIGLDALRGISIDQVADQVDGIKLVRGRERSVAENAPRITQKINNVAAREGARIEQFFEHGCANQTSG
jgi:hypothetical protein